MIDKINKIKEITNLYSEKKFHEAIDEAKKFIKKVTTGV